MDGVSVVAAAAAVVAGIATWGERPPHVSASVLVTLAGLVVLALLVDTFLPESTVLGAMPIIAGVVLTVLGASPHDLLPVLPVWALGVAVGYRLLAGPFRRSGPRAAAVVLAGAVAVAVMTRVTLGHAPYDRALLGLLAFVGAHRALEWLRDGSERRPVGHQSLVLALVGLIYACGLVLVADLVADIRSDPWPAVAAASVLGLGGLVVAQFARITMLARVTDALTEASSATPWPPGQVDDTLIRLVSDHVRAATVAIEERVGGPGTLSEPIRPGSVLVVRRDPRDFGFSRYDGRLVAGLVAMARASHAQAARESQLWVASVTDELTGLWEYEHWRGQLSEQSRNRGGGEKLGVIFLDLDHFKQINSDDGHLRADRVLAAIGDRLRRQSPQWRFGRFGGDEFVGLARNVRDEAHLDELCRDLAALICEPVRTDDRVITVTASIGRVVSADRGESPDVVLAHAERNLRARKAARERRGLPSTVLPFDEEEILRRLLDQGVDVAYQPVMDVRSRQIVGWEALLRGSLPLLGDLSPEELVDSAVRVGVVDVVTRQVAKQAIAASTEIAERLDQRLSLRINLELEQFSADRSLIKWITEQQAGCGRIDLVLEITERGPSDSWGATEDELIERLEERGIGVSLDDLGAGNARLGLLIRRPWHSVKLDRSFLTHGEKGAMLLEHTVAMLHDLGLVIVMEGVETAEQFQLVERLGIDQVQGHYFAPAGTAAELTAFIDRHRNGLALP